MAHQLYVLQVLTFNLLEERMMTKMDPNDQAGAGPPGVKCCFRTAVLIPPSVWAALGRGSVSAPSKLVWAAPLRTWDRALSVLLSYCQSPQETDLGAHALLFFSSSLPSASN